MNGLWSSGDGEDARRAANQARLWNAIRTVAGLVGGVAGDIAGVIIKLKAYQSQQIPNTNWKRLIHQCHK